MKYKVTLEIEARNMTAMMTILEDILKDVTILDIETDRKIWNRLTEQEKIWVLSEKNTPDDVETDVDDTIDFLKVRYASNGSRLHVVQEMIRRLKRGGR